MTPRGVQERRRRWRSQRAALGRCGRVSCVVLRGSCVVLHVSEMGIWPHEHEREPRRFVAAAPAPAPASVLLRGIRGTSAVGTHAYLADPLLLAPSPLSTSPPPADPCHLTIKDDGLPHLELSWLLDAIDFLMTALR